MTKEILVFDKGTCVGQVEVEIAVEDFVVAFAVLTEDGSSLYVLYLPDMDYGIVISKEVYCHIEKNIDARDEEN